MEQESPEQRRQLEEYYSDLKEMFLTPGWKNFLEDMEKSREAIDSIRGPRTLEDLWYQKGQLLILDDVLNFQSMAQNAEAEHASDS